MSVAGEDPDITAAAAEWVIRLEGGPLGGGERRALDRWLAAHPAHRAAFDRAQALWREIPGMDLAADRAADSPAHRLPTPGLNPTNPKRRARGILWYGTGGLIALAATILLWLGDPIALMTADYTTRPGHSRTVSLPDGSRIELGTGSAIALHFSDRERRVDLLAGEAYVTVAPLSGAETRPFIVTSANSATRALGTVFDVMRAGDDTLITGIDHQIEVTADRAGAAVPDRAVLSPGQMIRSDRTGLGPVQAVDADRATAWRRGKLIFDRAALRDVVDVLNRYRRGRILIADPELAERRVSGIFETTDLERALTAITAELGMRQSSLPLVTVIY